MRTLAVAFIIVFAVHARGADRFVSGAGSDTANDCLSAANPCRTITAAVGQAASGDTVKVAAGALHDNVLIDVPTSLTIAGGWTLDFSVQDPALNVTRVSGDRVGRVFDVVAGAGETIDLSLDGLTITPGYRCRCGSTRADER